MEWREHHKRFDTGFAMSILRKVKLLEEYVAADASAVDPTVELASEKLLKREACRLDELKQRLLRQKAGFEEKYGLEFHPANR